MTDQHDSIPTELSSTATAVAEAIAERSQTITTTSTWHDLVARLDGSNDADVIEVNFAEPGGSGTQRNRVGVIAAACMVLLALGSFWMVNSVGRDSDADVTTTSESGAPYFLLSGLDERMVPLTIDRLWFVGGSRWFIGDTPDDSRAIQLVHELPGSETADMSVGPYVGAETARVLTTESSMLAAVGAERGLTEHRVFVTWFDGAGLRVVAGHDVSSDELFVVAEAWLAHGDELGDQPVLDGFVALDSITRANTRMVAYSNSEPFGGPESMLVTFHNTSVDDVRRFMELSDGYSDTERADFVSVDAGGRPAVYMPSEHVLLWLHTQAADAGLAPGPSTAGNSTAGTSTVGTVLFAIGDSAAEAAQTIEHVVEVSEAEWNASVRSFDFGAATAASGCSALAMSPAGRFDGGIEDVRMIGSPTWRFTIEHLPPLSADGLVDRVVDRAVASRQADQPLSEELQSDLAELSSVARDLCDLNSSEPFGPPVDLPGVVLGLDAESVTARFSRSATRVRVGGIGPTGGGHGLTLGPWSQHRLGGWSLLSDDGHLVVLGVVREGIAEVSVVSGSRVVTRGADSVVYSDSAGDAADVGVFGVVIEDPDKWHAEITVTFADGTKETISAPAF